MLAGNNSESETEIQQTRKPAGGLLSRLQTHQDDSSENDDEDSSDAAYERTLQRFKSAKAAEVFSSDDEEDDNNGEDAYERMKRQLAAGAAQQQVAKPAVEETNPEVKSVSVASSDEEEDGPIRPAAARRIRPAEKTSSPAPTTPSTGRRSLKRIRAERLAQKKEENKQQAKKASQGLNEESESNSDGENGRRLTQQSKPTRKASKKAMEAMVRDQQRIVRSMQLTHQSKTKKRYSTKDLLAKFGFPTGDANTSLPTPDASSPPASPNPETEQTHDTPSGVPPNEDGPSIASPPPPPTSDKGKGRAPEFQHLPAKDTATYPEQVTVHSAAVDAKTPASGDIAMVELSESDDDLEIVQPKSRFAVFDKIPERKAQEPTSLLHLRHLAQLTSGNDRGSKGQRSMNSVELQISLQQKARLQNRKAREERLAELKAKGIHIETEEEREKRQAEVEDMVAQYEKDQERVLALGKKERKQAKENGESGDGLVSSDEEDEDYLGSDEDEVVEGADDEDEDEMELVLSGSEEEADEADEEMSEKPHGFFDDLAEEDEEEPEEPVVTAEEANDNSQLDDGDEDETELSAPSRRYTSKRAKHVVVDDEDEDQEETVAPGSPTQQATQGDDPLAAFGFGNAAPALGLTQAFAGTMASLNAASQDQTTEPEQDSLQFLRSLPDTQPLLNSSQATIPNSQPEMSQDGPRPHIDLGVSQLFQAQPEFSATQLSEVPEPTQDAGFLLSRSPAGLAAVPSTVDTVMMPTAESPIKERKGKLRRRAAEAAVELSDADEDMDEAEFGSGDANPTTSAKDVFNVMKKAAKKQRKIEEFNKQTSWAKDIVEEQAEESEDEYAGIGGISDDESGNEMDEELAKMIDTSEVVDDKSSHERFYNETEAKRHQQAIEQMYKDVTTGGLRKRAAGRDAFDLSDSEDEAELRRRKWQRERQRMSKAILADERIGKLAQNAKQQAFINSMIDTYDDAEYGFLEEPEQPAEESQSQSQPNEPAGTEALIEPEEEMAIPDSQASQTANPLKRKSPSLDSHEKENRPPANQRRTAAPPSDNPFKKARTLPEIQHQLSELLEDPRVIVPDSQYISDSDNEEEAPAPKPKTTAIIDRLSLSRSSTTLSDKGATTTVAGQSMAFSSTTAGFRVPSLVRRATSNFSTVSERSSSGAATPTEGTVRRGGTGKSNIHAQAREAERRAVLEKAEVKRKEVLRKKVGKARGVRSVLGGLHGGFE
ncbi:hypothetical protein DM02DRAFT_543809 [Periconia macrospinosa]|uniref:DNA replication checkpoint mediator MRC1 domain-containing protein n=1 Tax=Periconia macrospinosa TaxID=97972 RepID=A0A2V1D413_9PLEO|nr:hypothetical protein DM02DRAFT_543809 [Periconia macrospinosa]